MTNGEIHLTPMSRPRLERSRQGRVVGGVCAAAADDQRESSRATAIDAAMTKLGDRLCDPAGPGR